MDNLLFIINPKAGNGDIQLALDDIGRLARDRGIDYETYFTTAQNDGCNQVKLFLKQGYRNFIVMGGDGTINEVVNGIFQQQEVPYSEIAIGLISKGTGNDWGRYYHYTGDHLEAFRSIISGKISTQDIGVIRHTNQGELQTSYFANIAGFGFDAEVVMATNRMMARGRRKQSAYLFNLLKCLISNKSVEMRIESDGRVIEGAVFSISVGNGKYSGGGMMQTPAAIIDDGLLDVTIYLHMPKTRVLANVKRLYNGTIQQVKGIISLRSKHIKIEFNKPVFAETDGEIIGDGPYEISVLPGALRILGVEK